MILYFASDLLWASKIKGAADALQIPARPVRDTAMLSARLSDCDVSALILDLDAPDRAFELLAHLRAHENTLKTSPGAAPGRAAIRVAAFGPHVETAALKRALDQGCDPVLTRGAMDRSMHDVLRALHGPREP